MPLADRTSTRPAHEISGEYVRIGVITGTHGLKGAVRFRPDNVDSTALEPGMRVILEGPRGRETHRIVEVTSLGHRGLRIVFADVCEADASAALKGCALLMDAKDLPAPEPGEFYHFQALGCEVVTLDGRRLGNVAEILPTGANDVMVVRDGAREILVPVIADVVQSIDLEARRVTIDPIPGLLD